MGIPDIEVIIARTSGQATASLRVELPNRRADLAEDVPIALNDEILRSLLIIPDAYAGALTGMVFVPALREAWQRALGYVEGSGERLRVRLHLRGDDALHALRWELLRDPVTQTPLAYRERVAFSRYLSSDHLGDVQAATKPQLSAIFAVSRATGPGMAPVDVADEAGRALAALGEVPLTVLDGREDRPAASLPALAAALRDGSPLLYLVCHGVVVNDQPLLYLERLPGEPTHPIPGAELVRQVAALARRPLLVVLASCRSAGDSYTTLATVGPQLARSGVGAVIAMQGDVPMELVAQLTTRLLSELDRDGQIDRALAAARAALPVDQPWWMPVLWMVMKDGALWRAPEVGGVRGAGVFQVPYPPNPLFCGREAELKRLAEALEGEQAGIAAVSGTGGIGKTQLASEFAHRHRDDFPGGVFWLNMADSETVPSQVAAASGPGGLDLPGWSELDFEAKVAAVRRVWSEPVRRLLVFDNLEEPRMLQEWRPSAGGARVLVTTRRGIWSASSGVRPIALQTLARPESMRLLLASRYGDQLEVALADPRVVTEADAICEQVGDLPLALALASTYLEQTPSFSLAGYKARLAETLLAHPSLDAELEEGLPTRHAASVIATIALSYRQLDPTSKRDELAFLLLRRAARLAPAPIPHRLLIRLIERDPGDEEQAADVDAALRRLAAVGLVERLPEGGATLHRLVAAFVCGQDADERASAELVAAGLITEVNLINSTGYPMQGTPYLPHLITLSQYEKKLATEQLVALQTGLSSLLHDQGDLAGARSYLERAITISEPVLGSYHPNILSAFNNLGLLLYDQGDLIGARPYLENALALREQVLGLQHPDTATSLHNFGLLLRNQGDLTGARPYLERALAIWEPVLGPQHPITATGLQSLGGLLHKQGDLTGARPYLERALAIREQVLGPKHPEIARSLDKLGLLLSDHGDPAGARTYLERALAIREQVLGPQHPNTATSLHNLGLLLHDQGDLTRARSYLERALDIWETVLEPQHPDILSGLNNLGLLLRDLGNLTEARSYFERVLALREHVLGPQHPDTATSLHNLGLLLQDQGDLQGARHYFERALAIWEQVLGPQHPNTATNFHNLGLLLRDQGDLQGARHYFERALVIREQVLGPQHSNTATTLNSLGLLIRDQGDYASARPYLERALTIREQVLSPQHPDIAMSLHNLGLLLRNQGDLTGARPYLEHALTIWEQVLGPQHPNTATTFHNLGLLLQDQGDLQGARHYFERALAIREQVLGPQHPNIVTTLNSLGLLIREQGDYASARPYYERALTIREQVLGPQHPDTGISLSNLGTLLHTQGDLQGARPYFQRALTIFTASLGAQHSYTQTVQRNLAALDVPQESREEQIARLTNEAEIMVATVLASNDIEQYTTLSAKLERQAQWAEQGEAEGSPYLVLAVRLRELAAQLE